MVFLAGIAIAVLNTKDTWAQAWDAIKAAFETALRGILTSTTRRLVPMFNALATALDVVKGVWDTVWGAIGSSLGLVLRPARAAINAMVAGINAIKSALNSLKSFMSNLKLPSLNLPSLGSLKIPGFAEGVRNFAGGAAVVGERGPELVNLPRGSNVTPMGAGAGGGGGTVNINFYGDVYGIEDFNRKVNEARTSFGRRGN